VDTNVPSKVRGCAAAHVAKKRSTVIFYVICVDIGYIWRESSHWTPGFGLKSGDWM